MRAQMVGLIAAWCLGVSSPGWSASVRMLERDGLSIVRLKNNQVTVEIAANSGARICSLVRNADKTELVWWRADGRSGILDDKSELSAAGYAVQVEESGPARVSVTFSASGVDVEITKRVTLIEGESALRVEYTYTNPGDAHLEAEHMVRNYYLAGGTAGSEDRYFWHGARGVESLPYPYGDIGRWHEVEYPWYAVIDQEARTGLAIVVDSPALHMFYNWADGPPPNPSVEWTVGLNLGPGESLTVPVTLALLEGMPEITSATPKAVTRLTPQADGTTLATDVELTHVADAPPETSVRFRYETLDRVFVWEEVGMEFPAAGPGQVLRDSTTHTLPAEGTYVLTVEATSGETQLTSFEVPVVVGKSSGSYFKGRREGEQSYVLAAVTDRDVRRGYAVHYGGPEPPFSPAGPLEIAMGVDELESLEICVLALRDLGSAELSVAAAPPLPDGAVLVRTQARVSTAGPPPAHDDCGLFEGNRHELATGDHKSFWVTLDGREMAPGRYPLTLTLRPEAAEPRALHVVVRVLDVTRAPPEAAALRLYGPLTYISGNLAAHARLLTEAGVREVQVYFPFNAWKNAAGVHRGEDGELVIHLDGVTARLEAAQAVGFDRLGFMYHLHRDDWFSGLEGEAPEAITAAKREFDTRLIQHCVDLGFEQIWIYALDEPSVPDATKPETLEQLRSLKAVHPELKVHMTINHFSPDFAATLDPVLDIWTPSRPICWTLLEDMRSGHTTLDATDEIGFYQGAFCTSSPDDTRTAGWQAAFLDVTHYSLFAYHQGIAPDRLWVLFANGPEGPVTTSGLEGVRDGYEDYAYWRRLSLLLQEADKLDEGVLTEAQRDAIRGARAFRESAFSMEPDALVPMTMNTGGHGARSWPGVRSTSRLALMAAKVELLERIDALNQALAH